MNDKLENLKTYDASAEQSVHRVAAARDWLYRVNARPLWEARDGDFARVEAFALNGYCVLLTTWLKTDGWDLFVAASRENAVEPTLCAVALACGLPAAAGRM
jgi:hypothetical protein